MFAWMRRHWLALIGYLSILPALLKGVVALVRLGGDVDFVISRWEQPGWVAAVINWFIDPPDWALIPMILLGFVLIYWDTRRKSVTPQPATPQGPDPTKAQRELSDLFDDGVRERNRLLAPIQGYNEKHERRRLTDWSDKVVQALDAAGVKLAVRSRFKTLNLFVPQHQPVAGRPQSLVKLEAIWNEKLKRLREIIERFPI